jgi:circadian clock protein KaiB
MGSPLLLMLYVAGKTPNAQRALEDRQRLIAATGGDLAIHIIDILVQPDKAEAAGILATPTLSDESCEPARRLIGDLGNVDQVLDYFGYRRKEGNP